MNKKKNIYQTIPSKDHHWDNASCRPQFPCWLLFWNHESNWTSWVQQSTNKDETKKAMTSLYFCISPKFYLREFALKFTHSNQGKNWLGCGCTPTYTSRSTSDCMRGCDLIMRYDIIKVENPCPNYLCQFFSWLFINVEQWL